MQSTLTLDLIMANRFERKEVYQPHEVLEHLPNPNDYPKGFKLKRVKKEYDGDMMKMGSDRYYTFKKSLCCVHCGIVGSFMAKERHVKHDGTPLSESYHFNLYGIDKEGNDILMTKDHIKAKSRGGKNSIRNYVTMCAPCNEEKGSLSAEKALKLAKDKQKSIAQFDIKEGHRTTTPENNDLNNLTWIK